MEEGTGGTTGGCVVCGVWRSLHGAGGRSYQSALSPGSTQGVEL